MHNTQVLILTFYKDSSSVVPILVTSTKSLHKLES